MVRDPPLRINYRAFPHLNDAIAGLESCSSCSFDEIHMRPLIFVIVNVVGNLT